MKQLVYLLTICFVATRVLSQSNTIATDTIRINGQAGAVNLITGSQTRTLNFPAGSGTLALEGEGGTGQCCPTDTSFVMLNETAVNAAKLMVTSKTYDVGRFGRELILTVLVNFPGVVGDALIQLETCSDLNNPLWYPVIAHRYGNFQAGAFRSWVIRPAGTSEFQRSGGAIFGETPYTETFGLKAWMKYIRLVAILWNGQAGKSVLANVTVR